MKSREALDHITGLIKRFHGSAGGRISVWPSPANPNMVTQEGLLGCLELARHQGLKVPIHLEESEEDRYVHGMRATQYLEAIGFLAPEVVAGHCVQVDEAGLHLLSEHNVKVTHQPVANCYLADGIAPVPRMVRMGITVGLGTDNASCNNSVNILSDMKYAALLHRVSSGDPSSISAKKVVEMATIDGAVVLGMENQIGSLEVGKKADIIGINLRSFNLAPCHDVYSTLVFQANGSEVEWAMVDGRLIMEDGRPLTLPMEREELIAKARSSSAAILKRANLA